MEGDQPPYAATGLQWKSMRKEARDKYLGRLRRTATRLPRSFLDDSISDMARRCRRLHEAKGGHFEERGRSQ